MIAATTERVERAPDPAEHVAGNRPLELGEREHVEHHDADPLREHEGRTRGPAESVPASSAIGTEARSRQP